MSQGPFLYPPQIRNRGSPPAHLSSSTDAPIDPSSWLKIKWCQLPLHAPDWVIDKWYACAHRNDDWLNRAWREDTQDVGLLPPLPLVGPILTGGCALAEQAYQHWKRAVGELWEDERHHLQTPAPQRLLNEQAARQLQEAAHCQCLLNERIALKG
jgi:hypothetical protein